MPRSSVQLAVCLCTLAALVFTVHGATVTTGPQETIQAVGTRFTLTCSVSDKTDSDRVSWSLTPHTTGTDQPVKKSLTTDHLTNNPNLYEVESGTYNLIVLNASYQQDGTFECSVSTSGTIVSQKSARVYIYDKPDNTTLTWEGIANGPDAVEPNRQYNLKCDTINSHPPASHRYYKDGVELTTTNIVYTYHNSTNTTTGYGNVTSVLPITLTPRDVNKHREVRCEADLYTVKNVSSAKFYINGAPRTGFAALLAIPMAIAAYTLR